MKCQHYSQLTRFAWLGALALACGGQTSNTQSDTVASGGRSGAAGSGVGGGEPGGAQLLAGAAGTQTRGSVLARPVPHGATTRDVLICEFVGSVWAEGELTIDGLQQFILYGDGLVVFGPDADYCHGMQQARVNEDGVQRLLGAMDDLGLFSQPMSITGNVADATSSSLRLVAGGRDVLHRVYPAREYGVTAEGLALSQGFPLATLEDLPAEMIIEPPRAFELSRVHVDILRFVGTCPDELAWPLSEVPDVGEGGTTCLDLDAAQALPLAPAATATGASTMMQAGDACYFVTYRPVLPHEVACADGWPKGCFF